MSYYCDQRWPGPCAIYRDDDHWCADGYRHSPPGKGEHHCICGSTAPAAGERRQATAAVEPTDG